MQNYEVVVADDDARMRRALAALLETDPRLRVVAAVGDGGTAIEAAASHQPALAIVDVRMPDGGETAVRGILAVSPRTAVVVCSSYDDRVVRARMRAAGACGFVVKGGGDELLDVARDALGWADATEPEPLA